MHNRRPHHVSDALLRGHALNVLVKPTLRALIAVSLAVCPLQADNAAENQPVNDKMIERRPTDIRADKVEMDFKNGVAVFSGNVIVSDGKMILEADTMTVRFTPQNRLDRIEASGTVTIVQSEGNRRATAGKGVYLVDEGKIVLTDNPQLRMGKNTLQQAEKITYYQKEEKFQSEGKNQTLRFIPDEDHTNLDLFEDNAEEGNNDAE